MKNRCFLKVFGLLLIVVVGVCCASCKQGEKVDRYDIPPISAEGGLK